MVMLLLQRQANVEARDASQQTALRVAASRGFPNVCNSLLDYGAQSERRDGDPKTPMKLAIAAGYREVVDLLLARLTLRPTDTNLLLLSLAQLRLDMYAWLKASLTEGLL